VKRHHVALTVNGEARDGLTEPRTTLADFLREELELTGTHLGCEHGVCGACTVLLDGEAVRSCLVFAVQANGHDVVTIEGLADVDDRGQLVFHPLQQAFYEAISFQ
jgi:carbon-monoxide dehydrogenase small subunit